MVRAKGFPAVVGRAPRVLILGSLPGVASIRAGQYYGHPQNKFWELMGAVLRTDLRGLSYARRLSTLKKRKIALWDVVADAERPGSLDSDIADERHNDVHDFAGWGSIKAVFFNGSTAFKIYRRRYGKTSSKPAVVLPSSSPANASVPMKVKRKAWLRIRRYL